MKDSTGWGTAQIRRLPAVTSIAGARPQTKVDVSGVIRAVDSVSIGGIPTCRCTLADDTGEIDLLFLGRPAVTGLGQGRRCRAVGTAATRGHRTVLWNPRYWLEPAEAVPASRNGAGPEWHGLALVAPLARIQP
jgi:hypothetical protein